MMKDGKQMTSHDPKPLNNIPGYFERSLGELPSCCLTCDESGAGTCDKHGGSVNPHGMCANYK